MPVALHMTLLTHSLHRLSDGQDVALGQLPYSTLRVLISVPDNCIDDAYSVDDKVAINAMNKNLESNGDDDLS